MFSWGNEWLVLEIFAVEHSFEDAARRSRQADVRIGLCSLFMRKPYRKRSSGYGDAEIGRVGLPREGRHDGRGRGSRAAGEGLVLHAAFVGAHADRAVACDLHEIDVRALREAGNTAYIIGVSADAMSDERSKAFEAGMNDFLPKPVDPDLMFSMLLRWLRARKA